MSDPTAAKRLRAEARTTCAAVEAAAKKLLAWADQCDGAVLIVDPESLRSLGLGLSHQGGRLDMAVNMAETRRKRK